MTQVAYTGVSTLYTNVIDRSSAWLGLKTSTQGKMTTMIDNKYFENMEQFKYLGTTLTNQNSTHEDVKWGPKSCNVCYQSMQNILFSSSSPKNVNNNVHRIIILPVALHGYENWSVILREEYRLRVFENRVLKKRTSHDEELYDLYSSPNIIRMVKFRRLRWSGHVAGIGKGEAHTWFWWREMRERDNLEDIYIDGRMTLKSMFKKWDDEA
jgi:nitrous oxidase accessory protein NosD